MLDLCLATVQVAMCIKGWISGAESFAVSLRAKLLGGAYIRAITVVYMTKRQSDFN